MLILVWPKCKWNSKWEWESGYNCVCGSACDCYYVSKSANVTAGVSVSPCVSVSVSLCLSDTVRVSVCYTVGNCVELDWDVQWAADVCCWLGGWEGWKSNNNIVTVMCEGQWGWWRKVGCRAGREEVKVKMSGRVGRAVREGTVREEQCEIVEWNNWWGSVRRQFENAEKWGGGEWGEEG